MDQSGVTMLVVIAFCPRLVYYIFVFFFFIILFKITFELTGRCEEALYSSEKLQCDYYASIEFYVNYCIIFLMLVQ